MSTQALSIFIKNHFKKVEAKDIDAVLADLNEDAEFIDPHYPKVHMKGKEEIHQGLTWGFKSLKKLGFSIINYYESKDATGASIEVETAHILPNGKKLNFKQVFIIEMKKGKINRLQAYEPYGPHGMFKVILIITRFIRKITRT